MEGAKEKKKKVPFVPETLKKKKKGRNFVELKTESLKKKVCPKDASKDTEEAYLWQNLALPQGI